MTASNWSRRRQISSQSGKNSFHLRNFGMRLGGALEIQIGRQAITFRFEFVQQRLSA